jgi:molybdate transport system ATP-binding protein
MPFITFRDVTLQLRDRRILQHIDWSLRSSEHWAIVGANGSGKSVLARTLYGSVPVVGGEVVYHFLERGGSGKERSRRPALEDCVAHVSFEDQRRLVGGETSYYQSRWNSIEAGSMLTVLDVLSSTARKVRFPVRSEQSGAGGKTHRFRQPRLVEQLGIGHLLDRKIVRLSNGETRRVLVAQALLQSPVMLILDDPFVGLDYRSRRTLKRIVNELMKGPMRVVFITSHVDEIPSAITHVLWLEEGGIVAAGDKKMILNAMRSKRSSARTKQISRIRKVGAKPRDRASFKPRSMFEIRNASVIYDDIEVLKGINWIVKEGENWALLGPNGSGKTTLLSLILADNPQAYSNEIYWFGRRRGSGESIWDIKKNIGLVSPEIQIHYQKHMTSHDVVCSGFFDSIGLYRECSARQERRASAWIRSLGLSDLAGRRFDELSAGHQRMVLIARASVRGPRLLILDEPCQGLDLHNREIILETVDAIGRTGMSTLIYVTHRLTEIPGSISHVLRLRNGQVVRKGTRAGVLGT